MIVRQRGHQLGVFTTISEKFFLMATADRALGGKGIGCYLVERKREGVKIGKEENILK